MADKPFRADMWIGKDLDLGMASVRLRTEFSGALGEHAVRRSGRKADVFRVTRDNRDMAMKVFFRRFVDPRIVVTTAQLRRFETVPGLTVCAREVIAEDLGLASVLEALNYAVVMPWIEGTPWAAWIEEQTAVDRRTSLALARAAGTVLARLEAERLVHGDLSSSNVLIPRLQPRPSIELIDVEDMFHPDFVDIPHPPDGSPGYQHPRNIGKGCWNPYGDRFSASILLTEMLTWHDPDVRASRYDATLFAQDELCRVHSKYVLVCDVLRRAVPAAARLFEQAWSSTGLAACPSLGDWDQAIRTVAGEDQAPARFERMPSLTPALFARLGEERNQTSFVSTVACSTCKAKVTGGDPKGHAFWCPHHPFNFEPLLPAAGIPASGPASTHLDEMLSRFTSQRREPRPQFEDITFRSFDHPSWGPPTRPVAPEVRNPASPLGWLAEPAPGATRVCPKCSRLVTTAGGTERGHSLLCTEGAVAAWWKDL